MNLDTMLRAFPGLGSDRARQLLPGLNQALTLIGAHTVNEAAMFCAQIGEESISLRYTEEIASGAAYEWRGDLGNNQPGDGIRFKGRSLIQITGRHNYSKLSEWAAHKGLVPYTDYFLRHPTALADDTHAWLGPVWYWTIARPQMAQLARAGDVYGATRAVNGGLNGIDDRLRRWHLCRELGDAILPTDQPKEFSTVDSATTKYLQDMEHRLNARIDRVAGNVWAYRLGRAKWQAGTFLRSARGSAAAAARRK